MAGLGMERGAGGGIEYNGFGVGPRRYGAEHSTTATSGTLSKVGYVDRDRRKAARRKAIQGMITTTTPAVPPEVQRGMGTWRS